MDNNQNENVVTTNKVAKKNNTTLIIAIVAVLLLVVGGTFLLLNKGGDKEEKKEEPAPKVLRKILPEELNDETAKEIIQFFADTKMEKEKWTIDNAILSATDGNNGFVVNYESTNDTGHWYLQTILTYKDDTWTMEIPTWKEGEKDVSEYSIFYGHEE